MQQVPDKTCHVSTTGGIGNPALVGTGKTLLHFTFYHFSLHLQGGCNLTESELDMQPLSVVLSALLFSSSTALSVFLKF